MYDFYVLFLYIEDLTRDPVMKKITRLDFDQTQSAFTSSKLTIETLEQGVKYVPS